MRHSLLDRRVCFFDNLQKSVCAASSLLHHGILIYSRVDLGGGGMVIDTILALACIHAEQTKLSKVVLDRSIRFAPKRCPSILYHMVSFLSLHALQQQPLPDHFDLYHKEGVRIHLGRRVALSKSIFPVSAKLDQLARLSSTQQRHRDRPN